MCVCVCMHTCVCVCVCVCVCLWINECVCECKFIGIVRRYIDICVCVCVCVCVCALISEVVRAVLQRAALDSVCPSFSLPPPHPPSPSLPPPSPPTHSHSPQRSENKRQVNSNAKNAVNFRLFYGRSTILSLPDLSPDGKQQASKILSLEIGDLSAGRIPRHHPAIWDTIPN